MNVMIFSTDINLSTAIKYAADKEPNKHEICACTWADNDLRFIQYHLHEYQLVIVDVEMHHLDWIECELFERIYGENLNIPVIHVFSAELPSKEIKDKIFSETGITVDYTKVSWLHDILKEVEDK